MARKSAKRPRSRESEAIEMQYAAHSITSPDLLLIAERWRGWTPSRAAQIYASVRCNQRR